MTLTLTLTLTLNAHPIPHPSPNAECAHPTWVDRSTHATTTTATPTLPLPHSYPVVVATDVAARGLDIKGNP